MSNLEDLIKDVYNKNAEFGCEQQLSHGHVPDLILVIDAKSHKKLSPQMRTLYDFAISWKEAIWGFDIVDPNELDKLYQDENISKCIHLTGENYKPLPPSDPSDWCRTALLAVEDGGLGMGLCFYWWRTEDDAEPSVVYINGGSANIFVDITELFECLANGAFPENGDQIYKELEQQRGTLRD